MEKGSVSIIDIRSKDERVQASEPCANCGSFKKDLEKPDDPSRASGDRLQIPGARSSRDQSREVAEWLQSFEEGSLW